MNSKRRKNANSAQFEILNWRLGRPPVLVRMKSHNLESWNIVAEILAKSQEAEGSRLVNATVNHISGDVRKPGSKEFIKYCIRSGWLEHILV